MAYIAIMLFVTYLSIMHCYNECEEMKFKNMNMRNIENKYLKIYSEVKLELQQSASLVFSGLLKLVTWGGDLRRLRQDKWLSGYLESRVTRLADFSLIERLFTLGQGCQIFLGSNIPKRKKLYQMTTNYTKRL
jgi:hypothetical protein